MMVCSVLLISKKGYKKREKWGHLGKPFSNFSPDYAGMSQKNSNFVC